MFLGMLDITEHYWFASSSVMHDEISLVYENRLAKTVN